MKSIVSIIFVAMFGFSVYAQAPQSVKYQAVVRDQSGNILSDKTVSFKISILKGSMSGMSVYSETHNKSTNTFGLVDLEIGKGNIVTGTFLSINWGNDNYFIKIEIDPLGGTNFEHLGTSQLLSVPYSLYANTSLHATFAEAEIKALWNEVEYLKQYLKIVTVKDIDGNSYNTIAIGTQVWFVENLKTTKFNDGESIVDGNNIDWFTTTPAYCWYNKDEANFKNTYGALYNWYAVNTGKLCPEGWHVPSDAEWALLENYLITNGYNYDGTTTGNKIAKSLAATFSWESSTIVGSIGNTDYPELRNKTGLTMLPGGYRYVGGTFHNIGTGGYWWSSSDDNSQYSWNRDLSNMESYMRRNSIDKKNGFSVRCIKD